ncbi:hypothetical protein WJX73_007523 [Symbiochloris irregularis]|uniref:Guanylate cyclase domain-containing protein n=1 Tax=Symbiochloris irregularis TaxID=706552 RepID=A0AAW1P155_9CHLO
MPAIRQDRTVRSSHTLPLAVRAAFVWIAVFLLQPGLSSGQPNATICNTTCQTQQRTALTAFLTSADIPIVPLQTAAIQQPVQCSWQGITCCTTNNTLDLSQGFPSTAPVPCTTPLSVVAVLLGGSSNTPGVLPDQNWGSLSNTLSYVDLTANNVSGTLPSSLGQLTALKTLWLGTNQLQGSIPSGLFNQLTNMLDFVLDDNYFSGTVPSMAGMKSIARFSVANNGLTGQLPADWATSPLLQLFDVSQNSLTGTLPALGTSTYFRSPSTFLIMLADHNHLTGSLPVNLHTLPIAILDLSSNQLDGPLDPLKGMLLLRSVTLDVNGFTGTIPSTLFERVQYLSLASNALTGPVPAFVSASVRTIDISNNPLNGTLPALSTNSSLIALDILNLTDARENSDAPSGHLPDYLAPLDSREAVGPSHPAMICPTIVRNPLMAPSLVKVTIDPGFYDYKGCACTGTYLLSRDATGQAYCQYIPPPPWKIMIPLFILGGILVALSGKYTARLAVRSGGQALYTLGPDKSLPPDLGEPLTLVMTDVEGSTELWEWDQAIILQAQAMHEKILRKLARKYHGYEVATEGDAFLMAFHVPLDALAWCAACQQAMLSVEWPAKLQDHPRTCIRLYPDAVIANSALQAASDHGIPSASEVPADMLPRLAEVHPKDVLFWGLNVRMCVSTGICEKKIVNATTKRVEYQGQVMNTVKALADMPHGGQVIMDEKCFDGIKLRLADLCEMVPHSPNYEGMEVNCRLAGSTLDFLEVRRAQSEEIKSAADETEAAILHETSPALEAAPQLKPTKMLQKLALWATSMLQPGNQRFQQEEGLLTDNSRFSHLSSRNKEGDQVQSDSVRVIDMGTHLLSKLTGARLVVQLLVPGLEERARALPPLCSLHHTPGYFDAPSATACPFTHKPTSPLPPVTMVFCSIENLLAMKNASEAATELVLMVYRTEIRRLLPTFQGYECSEGGGEHMIAFQTPMAAVHFCFEVQQVMMQGGTGWSAEVLALPGCAAELSADGRLLWCGPRVRMGMCEGTPTSVTPHITSGRTDYWGPFVNRAARFANATARGGQIMAPLSVARALVEMWTGQSLELTSHGNPVMLCFPDFNPMPTSDPLPQAPLVTESGFAQAASMAPNTGVAPWLAKLRSTTASSVGRHRSPLACPELQLTVYDSPGAEGGAPNGLASDSAPPSQAVDLAVDARGHGTSKRMTGSVKDITRAALRQSEEDGNHTMRDNRI